MATRKARSNRSTRLIKLADNGEMDPYGIEGDEFEDEDEDDEVDVNPADTQLFNSVRKQTRETAALRRSVGELRQAVSTLAKSQTLMIGALRKQNSMLDYDPDMDPMDIDEPDFPEDEEELSLGLGDDEERYTELPTDVVPRVGDPVEKGRRRMTKSPKVAARLPKISKDDTATTFGEKDSDVKGNREYDQKNPGGRESTLIGGDAGDGPGPSVSVIKGAVDARLAELGLIMKSNGPGVGTNGGVPVNVDDLGKRVGAMSFQEINRLRVEMGELPAGVL